MENPVNIGTPEIEPAGNIGLLFRRAVERIDLNRMGVESDLRLVNLEPEIAGVQLADLA